MVTGKDIDGTTVTESFDISSGQDFTGSQEFSSITSVAVSGLAGTYSGNSLLVGIGGNVQVKKGAGSLWGITIGATAAGIIKLIDGVSGSTSNIGELKASIVEGSYRFTGQFAQGLRVILGAASKITVIYR